MTKTPELLELLKAGVHFGHKTSRWHPKMAPFIFGQRGGVHIIDLEKTIVQLANALEFIKELSKQGKVVLFVGTKKQASALIKKYAELAGAPYVETRWLGGTITNWNEIYKLIKKYLELKKKKESGELQKYTKKEQADFSKNIERMHPLVAGMSTLTKTPDALFIVDLKHEDTAVCEATQKGIPIVALCDSNVDPSLAQYPIPGNDDSVQSVELIIKLVAEAYLEGKAETQKVNAENTIKSETK